MKAVILAAVLIGLGPAYTFAADGQVLINQATVMASGGFPYTITQPGSHKLSGNLTVPNANISGIIISANNVTLDLIGKGRDLRRHPGGPKRQSEAPPMR